MKYYADWLVSGGCSSQASCKKKIFLHKFCLHFNTFPFAQEYADVSTNDVNMTTTMKLIYSHDPNPIQQLKFHLGVLL